MSPRSSFDELLCSCSSTDVSIYAQFCGSVLWNETVISGEIMVNQWDLGKKKKKTAHAIQYILHLILQDYEYFLCLETNYTLKKNYWLSVTDICLTAF